MYPSCVTHLSTHSSVPPSIHPPPRPSISVYIHSSTCPFILTSLHPSTYQSIYLYLQQMMFWASPSTRSWAGYCCCRDKLTLIWLHRNRCLNRHLNYTINNRDLDTVFWEHHGGGRDRGDGSLLSFTQKAHAQAPRLADRGPTTHCHVTEAPAPLG